jgi:N-acetyl sugar amidotransferase
MRYCKRCVMPDTRPGIRFDKNGVCYPCLVAEKRKKINWKARQQQLGKLCNKYRRKDGAYDCVVTVSGGKDSHYQVYVMKELFKMNPLLVTVGDSFTHTKVGEHNLRNISEAFGCDLITFNLNHSTMRKMVRLAFENYGSPTWPLDLAMYSVPLKIAASLNIPFIVWGENIAFEYGGPEAEETFSAKKQIKNDVVKPIDWKWWFKHGIKPEEVNFIKYPNQATIDRIDPVYLSYFYPWDGYKNYRIAKRYGFRDSNGEWNREGFIENYDQIDSLGYVIHPWLKYPKFGHARATDVSCYWIRNGYITREQGVQYVKEHDHKIDPKALDDFLQFTGYSNREFWDIVDKFYNRKLFDNVDGEWVLKDPIWKKKK